MSKRILIMISILLLLPATAFAHTGLENSTPSDKETITKPLNEIVLQFNTNIENLSTFTLTDKQGQKVKIDNIGVRSSQFERVLYRLLLGYLVETVLSVQLVVASGSPQ